MSVRSEAWGAIADKAIAAVEDLDDGHQRPMMYGYMLRAVAYRAGWDDPRVEDHLAKLYELRNADGGWGLGFVFTGPGGTPNPADTTYTVTNCDHVGPSLIEARFNGLDVPLADIQKLVDLTMTTQTCTFPTGKAIAYSRLPGQTGGNDNVTVSNGKNVHNVNAAAAWFLQQAQHAGCARSGLNGRIIDMTAFEVASFDRDAKWWPYKGTGADSDTDHAGFQAEMFYSGLKLAAPDPMPDVPAGGLSYPIGSEVAYQILNTGIGGDHDDEPAARIAWARLAGLPPGVGRMVGATTQWLVKADQYLATISQFVDTAAITQKSQIAIWAARAAAQALELEG
jgi:hypothetical protein